MASPRELRNPPIAEAIIDLRARLPESSVIETVRSAADRLSRDYPKREDAFKFESGFQVEKGKAASPIFKQEAHGFRLISEDGNRVVQFQRDGMSFSWLNAYPGWDVAFKEATRLWEAYRAVVSPERVTRLAVRTVNRLQWPAPTELSDYLEAPPESPEDVPILNFVTRVLIRNPNSPQMYANVMQSRIEPVAPDSTAVLLDIDAFAIRDLGADASEISEVFSELRRFKNWVFFSSLTDVALRPYE